MSHGVFEKIETASEYLVGQQEEADRLGRLPDETAKVLRESGLVRLLQPKEFGGFEADPRDFLAAVMEVGKWDPSSGWVAGVVGLHPWELAFNDVRVQEEVWGEDPDTWFASPYAPGGMAVPVDDGYVVNGHWKFSSGTDHCQWVVLGAVVGTPEGGLADPMQMLHIMVPRADYKILEDSWNVMGLEGTGSKDIVIENAFVPGYRTLDVGKVMNGQAAEESGRTQPLYQLPWSAVFPNGVSAGVIGIAEGVLRCALDYQKGRISVGGVAQATDPHTRYAIGEAASEIRGARAQLLYNMGEMYEAIQAGHSITLEQRVANRRDQVRVAWRAAEAADKIYAHCGGNAIRADQPLQRFWRGVHAGLNHAIFVPGSVYDTAGGMLMGQRPEGPAAAMLGAD